MGNKYKLTEQEKTKLYQAHPDVRNSKDGEKTVREWNEYKEKQINRGTRDDKRRRLLFGWWYMGYAAWRAQDGFEYDHVCPLEGETYKEYLDNKEKKKYGTKITMFAGIVAFDAAIIVLMFFLYALAFGNGGWNGMRFMAFMKAALGAVSKNGITALLSPLFAAGITGVLAYALIRIIVIISIRTFGFDKQYRFAVCCPNDAPDDVGKIRTKENELLDEYHAAGGKEEFDRRKQNFEFMMKLMQ